MGNRADQPGRVTTDFKFENGIKVEKTRLGARERKMCYSLHYTMLFVLGLNCDPKPIVHQLLSISEYVCKP